MTVHLRLMSVFRPVRQGVWLSLMLTPQLKSSRLIHRSSADRVLMSRRFFPSVPVLPTRRKGRPPTSSPDSGPALASLVESRPKPNGASADGAPNTCRTGRSQNGSISSPRLSCFLFFSSLPCPSSLRAHEYPVNFLHLTTSSCLALQRVNSHSNSSLPNVAISFAITKPAFFPDAS